MDLADRIPREPPVIAPIPEDPDGRPRPLWSVMIPVYNCAPYLPALLKSILHYGPGAEKMQIEVCDDASTDGDIAGLVHTYGKGRIAYFRQPRNVGSLRNFETCLNRSRGMIIHLLHGDDQVKAGFYREMERLFVQYPEIGAAFCRYVSIDAFNGEEMTSALEMARAGILENWLERLARKQRIQTPAMVVRRQVYETLGGFYGVHYGEDWEMWLRIAARYKVGYVPEVLAEYRKHAASISGAYILTGQNIRDLKEVMAVAKGYFTVDQWRRISRENKRFYADYAINTARTLWGRYQHRRGTSVQIREALNLSANPRVVFQAAKLCVKMLLGIKK
ncbi:MAG TPA: glycosyltransferase [Chitinophagaceae bacterium]|nr:glycosyltransferase [Chitinophagaceae bacterium]